MNSGGIRLQHRGAKMAKSQQQHPSLPKRGLPFADNYVPVLGGTHGISPEVYVCCVRYTDSGSEVVLGRLYSCTPYSRRIVVSNQVVM